MNHDLKIGDIFTFGFYDEETGKNINAKFRVVDHASPLSRREAKKVQRKLEEEIEDYWKNLRTK